MADYQGGYGTPRADLGMALEEYRRDGGGNWATPRLLPTLSVPKVTATFSAYPRAALLQAGDAKRAWGGEYNRISYEAADHTYKCQNYGLEQLIDDKERAFYSNDFDGDYAAMMTTEMRLKRIQEVRTQGVILSTTAQTACNTAGTFTDNSALDPWTQLSADIYGQVIDIKEKSRALTGIMPNVGVCSRKVFNLMKKNTALANRRDVDTVYSDKAAADTLKEKLGLEDLVVADEVQTTTAEGTPAASAVIADIWPKQYFGVILRAHDGATLAEPSLGRLIEWDFLPELSVISYREERRSSDVIRVEHYVQEYIYDYAYMGLIKVQT